MKDDRVQFRLSLSMMIKNFYFFPVFAIIIGSITYFSVSKIWDTMSDVKENHIPMLLLEQDLEHSLDNIERRIEKLKETTSSQSAMHYAALDKISILLEKSLDKVMSLPAKGDMRTILEKLQSQGTSLNKILRAKNLDIRKISKEIASFRGTLKSLQTISLREIDRDFESSRTTSTQSKLIVLVLSLIAAFSMVLLGVLLSAMVGKPVSLVTDKLKGNSRDIEKVSGEINKDTKKQAQVVEVATRELEAMIIDIIQGNITMSIDKQSEIAKGFAEFLKNFVERTSTEIAMGMMSISQQSSDARGVVQELVAELDNVGKNVKGQEIAIGEMVKALHSIVEANKEIKIKAQNSTESGDKATSKAYMGQEGIALISERLQEIRSASENVKEITDSLAGFTEDIKILALNMSLKVEDIKDDTGKSYGFEAMSGKVQQLAKEVEGLLAKSTAMLIPTIEGIAEVSDEARQAKNTIAEVTATIKNSSDESKAIANKIEKQADDIDKIEREAEKLGQLAQKSTQAIDTQEVLAKNVDEMLKDAEMLIEGVNSQTGESVEGARKVSTMMEQLRQTMKNIENGTGHLTEKSAEIANMFNTILELAGKSRSGAEQLEGISTSVRKVSRELTDVVKGASAH